MPMAEIITPRVACDLSEAALIDACAQLGVTTHGETLVCSLANLLEAEGLARKYQMNLVMLPPAMLKNPYAAWAVVTKTRGIFWSEGA